MPVVLIGLFVVRGAATFVGQYALAWTANQGVLNLRERDVRAAAERASGAVHAAYGQQADQHPGVRGADKAPTCWWPALLAVVRDSLTLVALLGYLIWLNWKLTLFVGVMFPLVAASVRLISRRMRRITLASQKATDELAYVIEENVLAWRIVRLHDAAHQQTARFTARSNLLRQLMMKSVAASALMTPVTLTLTACALSGVIVVALYQSRSGGTTVGGFAAFITAMLMLLAPIKKLSEVSGQITRGMAALERGVALVDDSPAEPAGHHAPDAARGDIELREVSLRYREDQPLALDRLTLHVRPGETVALVGPSGAGKSTLVHLLPRFVDPSDGSVLLDGVPLNDWQVAALRRQFALVSQDVVLFNDSVAANVALGAQTDAALDRERVREALRAANLLEFVESLPEGTGHADRPQRQPALGWPAPAPGDRARDLQGRADPDPGRGHLGAGQRVASARCRTRWTG